ncbi:hypothetical protein HW115_18860 [Verrucomicrobiaceae bacterium N1E253]|uniref:Uncharacterized protein n=1 Tax=Oceaniferula marina TaxID=2748318 RepID=A0A851GK22_9BACT|nr:hypothetical protein [Oceaniferula marina]NWK57686.1 hypothetical protein [Oceaniferula marina]
MKNLLVISVLLIAVIITPACKIGGTSSGSSGRGYGNLYVKYLWTGTDDGLKNIDWLIICSEFPSNQSYTGASGKWIISFKDGSTHEIVPSKGSVTWLSPADKPRLIEVDDIDVLVKRIDESQAEMVDVMFESPEALIREATK